MNLYSYPSIYAIGHKAIKDIFNDPVVVEEKIDGSQFSFGIIDGELHCRSKGKQIILDAPEKMFTKAIETVRGLESKIVPGYIYRCEYLQKPKHNTLSYDRTPRNYLIILDISTSLETYMNFGEKLKEATRLGLECVPLLYSGKVENLEMFNEFLDKNSVLGGTKIEGVVVKNYTLFTQEKKVAMGKYVSDAFKEVHTRGWKKTNPSQTDIVQSLIEKYKTPARWRKAVEHLRDDGRLEGSPRDIGNLIKETQEDVKKECVDEIKEVLFNHFWKTIQRGIVAGLPEWYKDELLKEAFPQEEVR